MSSSVTFIVVPVDDPSGLEQMYLDERRDRSGGWVAFPLRCKLFLDSFFALATGTELMTFRASDRVDEDGVALITVFIDAASIKEVIKELEALIEAHPEQTAAKLFGHGKGRGDVARVTAALTAGTWQESDSPAEEAAAFGRQLLELARLASRQDMSLCWEYRGDLKATGTVD